MAKWTKKLHFSKGSWVPVLIVASCTFVALWNPVPLQILRNALFDQFQRWQPRIYQQAPVRIIDIDDESLRRLGQWPWPRTRIAELISRLQAAHPASIALDVLFTEPDRTSPQAMLKLWQLAPTVHDQLRALPDHDEVLAKVISQGKVVLGFALERQGHAGVAPEVKARYILSGEPPQPYLHAFSGSLKPLATLESAASGLGAIAFLPDADGVVRRVPLVLRIGDTLVPSLSAEALRVALGVKNYQIKTVAGGGCWPGRDAYWHGQHTHNAARRGLAALHPTGAKPHPARLESPGGRGTRHRLGQQHLAGGHLGSGFDGLAFQPTG